MICAVVLAAGQSRRMGAPKLTLPWGDTTVIGSVVDGLQAAGIEQIVVVTGSAHQPVANALAGRQVEIVANADFAAGEMLSSLQTGLMHAHPACRAALVALGDQPQISAEVVRAVVERYTASAARLVVPSYRMRRGHPWLVDRALWPELVALRAPETARDFLNRHSVAIEYLQVSTPGILADLDTPEDYEAQRPK